MPEKPYLALKIVYISVYMGLGEKHKGRRLDVGVTFRRFFYFSLIVKSASMPLR